MHKDFCLITLSGITLQGRPGWTPKRTSLEINRADFFTDWIPSCHLTKAWTGSQSTIGPPLYIVLSWTTNGGKDAAPFVPNLWHQYPSFHNPSTQRQNLSYSYIISWNTHSLVVKTTRLPWQLARAVHFMTIIEANLTQLTVLTFFLYLFWKSMEENLLGQMAHGMFLWARRPAPSKEVKVTQSINPNREYCIA